MYRAMISDWIVETETGDPEPVRVRRRSGEGAEFILYGRDWEAPNRYVQIVVVRDSSSPPAARQIADAESRNVLGPGAILTRRSAGSVVISNGAVLWPSPGPNGVVTCTVDTFRFKDDGHIEMGLRFADDYVRWLRKNRGEVELSMWIADDDDHRRFMHVLLFGSAYGPESLRRWPGTIRFSYVSNPHVDPDSLEHDAADVLAFTGGTLERVRLRLPTH